MNRFTASFLFAACFPILACASNFDDGIRFLNAKSYGKATSAFEAAAKEGNSAAERQLAFMYYRGLGFKQDDTKAIALFELAAIHGDLESQVNLGTMYENGLSVGQSDVQSAHWFRLAAEQGHRKSQFRFGEICFLGAGIPRDYAEAAKWWDLAMRMDDDTTRQMRSMIQPIMAKITAATWEEGQRRADSWLTSRSSGQ
jgi:TPR repeat protein